MDILNVLSLGPPKISIGQTPCKFTLKKSYAVLLYCVAQRRPITRTSLRDLFWPGKGERALADLNNALFVLRKGLKEAGADSDIENCLDVTSEEIRFNLRCNHYYDVNEFKALARSATSTTDLAKLEQAVSLYRGDFLQDFIIDGIDDEFYMWVDEQQATLDKYYREVLRLVGFRYMAVQNWPAAIQTFSRLLKHDPEDQALYGLLMSSYAVAGQPSDVERTYKAYIRVLETLAREPDPAMVRLRDVIHQRQLSRPEVHELIGSVLLSVQHQNDSSLREVFRVLLNTLEAPQPLSQTVQSRNILRRAAEAAATSKHGLMGTLHLFLALYPEVPDLPTLGIGTPGSNWSEIAWAVRFVIGTGETEMTPTDYTLELENVLRVAAATAERSRAGSVEARYLWKALLQEEESPLGEILKRYGLSCSGLSRAIDKALSKH